MTVTLGHVPDADSSSIHEGLNMVTIEEWRRFVTNNIKTIFNNQKILEGRINKLNGEIATLEGKYNHLQDELRKLRDRANPVIDEHNKKQIIKLLSKETKPRSLRHIQNRLGVYPFHLLLQLELEGLIEHTKSGRHNMYAVVQNEKTP